MSQYDTQSLYEFLINTPESGLRKMLVDRQSMTDVHLNLLLKIARATTVQSFAEHFGKGDFPRIRLSPAEDRIKEKFWAVCTVTLSDRGLLVVSAPKAA